MHPPTETLALTAGPASDTELFDQLRRLIDETINHHEDSGTLLGVDPALPADPTARIVTARIDGALAGVVATRRAPDGSQGDVGSLAVARRFRGRGLATRLLRVAVEDRDANDGQRLPLFATIRVFPDGRLNLGSWRAFRTLGFQATARLRVDVAGLGARGWNLWPSAEPDGSIRQLLAARLASFDPDAAG